MKQVEAINLRIDLKKQEVTIHADEVQVHTLSFIIDETQITVVDTDTLSGWKRKGFGRLAFDALKMIAQRLKLPIYLWSLPPAFRFYERIGFLHLNDPEVQQKIEFGNVEKEKIFTEVDEDDFVWIPQHLKGRKPIIFM